MTRYKPYNLKQDKMIPLSYADQIVAGSFEYALNEIVEEHLDLTVFEPRYRNDDTGRGAYDPKVLLKIVLYGYCKGMVSSRKLAEACWRNVVFIALSADTRPQFTTIAAFVSELEQEIVALFRDVLLYCEELGLIGKEHFAVDGCKRPSNASKQWSGTHEELRERQQKMEQTAHEIVRRHRERDAREQQGPVAEQDEKKLATYRTKIQKIKTFLASAKPNMGPSGKERKSNITDPDSAKMATAHGVIQGYNGVAVVDGRHQIVVHAEALGEGQENHLLEPLVRATRKTFEAIGCVPDVFAKATLDGRPPTYSNVLTRIAAFLDASIGRRLAVGMGTMLLAMLILSTVYFVRAECREMEEILREKSKTALHLVGPDLGNLLGIDSPQTSRAIEDDLRPVLEDRDFDYAYVFDDHHVLAGVSDPGASAEPRAALPALSTLRPGHPTVRIADDYMEVLTPIVVDGERVAGLGLGVSLDLLARQGRRIRVSLLLLTAGLMTSALIFIYWWAHKTVAPVLQLTRGAERLSRGDLSVRVAVTSADEVGTLASTFNHLAASLERTLQEKDRALADANRLYRNLKVARARLNPNAAGASPRVS